LVGIYLALSPNFRKQNSFKYTINTSKISNLFNKTEFIIYIQ